MVGKKKNKRLSWLCVILVRIAHVQTSSVVTGQPPGVEIVSWSGPYFGSHGRGMALQPSPLPLALFLSARISVPLGGYGCFQHLLMESSLVRLSTSALAAVAQGAGRSSVLDAGSSSWLYSQPWYSRLFTCIVSGQPCLAEGFTFCRRLCRRGWPCFLLAR